MNVGEKVCRKEILDVVRNKMGQKSVESIYENL